MLNADDDFSNERIKATTTNATISMLNTDDADYIMDHNLKTLRCLMLDIESSLCEIILVNCHSNLNLSLTTK